MSARLYLFFFFHFSPMAQPCLLLGRSLDSAQIPGEVPEGSGSSSPKLGRSFSTKKGTETVTLLRIDNTLTFLFLSLVFDGS